MVPGQQAGSGKAAAGFRIPRPSAGWLGEGRERRGLVGRGGLVGGLVGALRAQGEL
jgi:hypothetical protein